MPELLVVLLLGEKKGKMKFFYFFSPLSLSVSFCLIVGTCPASKALLVHTSKDDGKPFIYETDETLPLVFFYNCVHLVTPWFRTTSTYTFN